MIALERILVVIDGTPSGQRAFEYSIGLAELTRSALTALLLQGKLPSYPALVSETRAAEERSAGFFDTLERLAQDEAAEHGVDLALLRQHGTLVRALVRQAGGGAFDLVVIGQRTGLLARVLGSRSARLVGRLPCPVLIVSR